MNARERRKVMRAWEKHLGETFPIVLSDRTAIDAVLHEVYEHQTHGAALFFRHYVYEVEPGGRLYPPRACDVVRYPSEVEVSG